MMNLVMTSAPLAMVKCNHSVTDATLGLQWHVLGMFAPSFFTGSLIARFGVERIIAVGLALILVSAVIGIAGISLWHFWIGLVLLGVGWNFAFIGATTMVTAVPPPGGAQQGAGFNDFLVFGCMAIGSFSSGKLLASFGWAAVNEVVFPFVLAARAAVWLASGDVLQPARAARCLNGGFPLLRALPCFWLCPRHFEAGADRNLGALRAGRCPASFMRNGGFQ